MEGDLQQQYQIATFGTLDWDIKTPTWMIVEPDDVYLLDPRFVGGHSLFWQVLDVGLLEERFHKVANRLGIKVRSWLCTSNYFQYTSALAWQSF